MAIQRRPPNRIIPQLYGDINNTDVNEIFRRLQELSSSVEGRRGPIVFKDSGEFFTDLRNTILKLKGKGDRATGSISFSGVTESSMFLAKGAYQTDTGAWIATETAPVILELRGDTPSPRMYRNVDLAIGAEFTPNPVGYIAVGDSTGTAVIPGSTTPLVGPVQPMQPRPHTHLYPDVVGLEDAVSVLASPLQSSHPTPHTHLVEDIPNRPVPEDVEWILAGQIFGG